MYVFVRSLCVRAYIFILVIMITSFSAITPSKSAPLNVRVENNILYISGPMDQPMADLIRHVDWNSVRYISFTSMGGWSGPALQIAKTLEQSGKPIIISDICASACLDVLVLKRVSLSENTLVFLHNSPIAQYYAVHRTYPKLGLFLKKYGEADIKWLIKHDIDPRLLLVAYMKTEPTCIFLAKDENSETAAEHLITGIRYQLWAPSNSTLSSFGLQLRGAPLQDAERVKVELSQRFPRADLKLFRVDEGNLSSQLPPFGAMAVMLEQTPVCGPNSLHGLPIYGSTH